MRDEVMPPSQHMLRSGLVQWVANLCESRAASCDDLGLRVCMNSAAKSGHDIRRKRLNVLEIHQDEAVLPRRATLQTILRAGRDITAPSAPRQSDCNFMR